MPKKTTHRVYWTIKLYKDVEARSADEAVRICSDNDYQGGTEIEDICEPFKVTKPNKSGYDVGKPNLLDK